ncbi:MAG TPA: ABC transporter permease [Acidobacteriaceae bacterium]|nr:ABC transporter permease [Acidobacteriaceae bacterium]
MKWRTARQREADLKRELQSGLELEEEEHRERGLSPEEAHYAALRAFGNPTVIGEQTRAIWSWIWFESLARDLRYCLRALRQAPGFTAIAILLMALGIGANVALFAVIRSVLLNPLPYREPDRLVALYSYIRAHAEGTRTAPIDAGSFFAWKTGAADAADMALISPFQNYNVSAENGQLPEKVDAAWVSANFFSVLGVQPVLGRGFVTADDRPEAHATAILSYSFWKRRYGGDPNVIGRTVRLDAQPYTVIGVMPASFVFLGPFSSGKIQIWTAVAHEAPVWLMSTFEDHEFVAVVRLARGVTLAQLLARLDVIQAHIKSEHPITSVRDAVSGRSLLDDAVQQYETPLYALFAATGCVLLIACLNIASLLVARAAARQREFAIRTVLGGGRMRLVRERVLESLLLTAGGGAFGIAFAAGAVRWLQHARPDLRRIDSVHLDWTTLAFAAAAAGLSALFSGAVSAFSIDARRILSVLQEASRTQSGGRIRARLRRALLALEVCITVVLLIGAGLLLKSYTRLRSTDLGIPADNLLTLGISLPEARYKTAVQQVGFLEQLIARVRAVPGVASAGLVTRAPGQGWGGDRLTTVVEHPAMPKGNEIDMMLRGADPDYFAAVHLPILEGRTFGADERLANDHVAIISKEAARVCFPGEDALGKHLRFTTGGDVYKVIGVVKDTLYRIADPVSPMMYIPIYGNGYTNVTVVVRSTHDVDALALPVEKVIGKMDPDLPVAGISTLQETIAASTLGSQFDSLIVVGFAVIALLLAAVGQYGVLAYLVTQRTGEIGIRIALGAPRRRVLRDVLVDGIRPALLGIVAGLGLSALCVGLIRSILYHTQPLDPYVFVAIPGLLLLASIAACLAPALRAANLDPAGALRAE